MDGDPVLEDMLCYALTVMSDPNGTFMIARLVLVNL